MKKIFTLAFAFAAALCANAQVETSYSLTAEGDTFTIIPEDPAQPYYYWVFSEEEMVEMAEAGYTNDFVLTAYCAYAADEEIHTGNFTDTTDEWWITGEYGTYTILVGPAAPDEETVYTICGPVTALVWNYDGGTTTGIETVNAEAQPAAKMMIDGRVVLNGHYNLNGVIVR